MRSAVAAFSAFALAVFLFSGDARSFFSTPALYAPTMTTGQVAAAPLYSGTPYVQVADQAYAVPVGYAPSAQPALSDGSQGWPWSQVAMLAVVGAIAGVAIGSALKGKDQRSEEMAADEEAAVVLAGPAPVVAMLAVRGETVADLEALAKKLNPAVGYFDPLRLSGGEFWGTSNEATIGWLRHSEIKHGRVAMAGFVGFCVHANGIHFPWKVPGDELCAAGVSPVALWQNIPDEAKYQIILALGLFEFYSEVAVSKSPGMGGHYMRGGKPGFFPPFKAPKGLGYKGIPTDDEGNALLPHPVPLNLFDPLGFSKNKTEEQKARGLQVEINNGRLAMIGLMGFLAEGAIPGSVPALKGLIPASGAVNVMSPFDM